MGSSACDDRDLPGMTFASLFPSGRGFAEAGRPRIQGRCWPWIRLRDVRQVHSPVVEAVAVQVDELVPGWAAADERFGYELMHILVMLVRVWLLVTEPLDGGPAGALHVVIDVSAGRVRETCGHASHASFKDLKPVILRVRCPWCNEQASWLLSLCIVHVTQCASYLPANPAPNRGTCRGRFTVLAGSGPAYRSGLPVGLAGPGGRRQPVRAGLGSRAARGCPSRPVSMDGRPRFFHDELRRT